MNDEPTLVDTNVLVHAYAVLDQRKHEQALAWLTRIWEGEKAATTLHNLCEFFFVVTRKGCETPFSPGTGRPRDSCHFAVGRARPQT